jgi:hypothetical protein
VEKLNYQDEDIHVYLVRGKEAPKSIREASSAVPVPDRRTSKRSRRTTTGNSISLKVSGSTTVYQLKLMIWESLGVCHAHRRYYLRKQPNNCLFAHCVPEKKKKTLEFKKMTLQLNSVSTERGFLN